MQKICSLFFLPKMTMSYLSTKNGLPWSNHQSTEFVQHLYTFALNRQCQKMFLENNIKNMVL